MRRPASTRAATRNPTPLRAAGSLRRSAAHVPHRAQHDAATGQRPLHRDFAVIDRQRRGHFDRCRFAVHRQSPQTERMAVLLDRETRVRRPLCKLPRRPMPRKLIGRRAQHAVIRCEPPRDQMRRVDRCRRRVPSAVSSTLIRLLTYAADTDSAFAAALKLVYARLRKTRANPRDRVTGRRS
ncbi:hypothetical protein LMG27177_06567 [Paraburkholderia fynbosensis]|uniref:Uncharacterized protein n=1 Tax=Paraburkholderia fynbosensis TaxID=1200993 RepID=A0A6J5H3Y5_9BURK|nr:hypothetical protein LMG27177_06567 [Paraburkholderia fynbosensis]